MATLPYWNNDEVISSDKLNSMVQAIINGDPLAVKVSNATKNDVNQIISYLSNLHDSAKTNLNSATSTGDFDTAYTNMTALVSNKLGSYANDDTVDLYSTGIRASIITFLQAYDNMMSNDRLNNKNTDNTLNSRIDSEAHARSDADTSLNNRLWAIQDNGGGRNILLGTRDFSGISIQGDKVEVNNSGEKFQVAFGTQNSSQTYFDLLTFNSVPLENDTDYTASFWVKTSEDTDIWSFLYNCGSNGNYDDGATISHATTEYTRIVVRFHNGNNSTALNFIPVRINKKSTITVWLYGCMLEKGTVAHDWQPAPEDVDTNINNRFKILQIGGTNLLKDTNKMTNTNYWELRGGRSIRAIYGNKRANEAGISLSDYNVKCVDNNPYIDYVPQVSFEQGTDYTVSFWTTSVDTQILYLNANDNANHQHNNSQQNISVQASGRTYNGWNQLTATFKPTVATAYLTFSISTAWVSSFKLEKGNKATDWSPSPDDFLPKVDESSELLSHLITSGRNYIQNSKSIIMQPNGTDNYDLVWHVYNDAFAHNAYCHDVNKTRFSFYLTPSKALPTARTFRIYWRAEPWTSFGVITVPANTTDTQYYELTATTPTSQLIANGIFIRFMKQDTSDISYTITNSMLTIGDSFPDWQPAPEDTDNYVSGRTITLPKNSSITVKDDRIIPHIYLPTYITDNLWNTDLSNLATSGEYDNAFISSATMATLTNRPTNPDTNAPLTGDCFYTNHYAYSGTTVRAFQKIYSCDYNYVFIRSYNSSSSSWSNWSCLTPYA